MYFDLYCCIFSGWKKCFFTALMEQLYQISIHCWSFVQSRLSVGPWWSSRDNHNLSHGWIPQLFIRDKRGTKFHSYSVIYHYFWWVLVIHYSEIIHIYIHIYNLYNIRFTDVKYQTIILTPQFTVSFGWTLRRPFRGRHFTLSTLYCRICMEDMGQTPLTAEGHLWSLHALDEG